ncbi:MAG: hypothetical protein ACRDRG_10315 [Pseudonocardiaceae bacterium]
MRQRIVWQGSRRTKTTDRDHDLAAYRSSSGVCTQADGSSHVAYSANVDAGSEGIGVHDRAGGRATKHSPARRTTASGG